MVRIGSNWGQETEARLRRRAEASIVVVGVFAFWRRFLQTSPCKTQAVNQLALSVASGDSPTTACRRLW
jgi:hypothetical protein